MALLCDSCGKVITTIYLIQKDELSFCSYRCYKNTVMNVDLDYADRKKSANNDLLGIKPGDKGKDAFLPKGDATGNSMVRAAGFERVGEYKKAINCWKRILILHRDDEVIIERAQGRIKILEKRLKSKRRGLKEGSE